MNQETVINDQWCQIRYNGNGELWIDKTIRSWADFGTISIREDYIETEWIPGWGSLKFQKSVWDRIVASREPLILKHPEWTGSIYEQWLAENQ